ncbi:ATP-binding protein [Amycolatopsis sp. NPDC003861]
MIEFPTARCPLTSTPEPALPAELTSYVGRRREGAEVRRLLGDARLVTLTGPGGVGKTRLAVRVAADVAAGFPGGVVFAGLAEVRDGALVANVVADRLGLHGRPGLAPDRLVVDHLRPRTVLLVLDNCEHVVGACAEFAATLLAECPHVVVLATSRQSLAVPGEQVLPVPPLEAADAVRLFRDRAARIWPAALPAGPDSERVLDELCARLDGLPLAIELAAARIRSLSPRQIADRLADRLGLLRSGLPGAPERQQTLRSAIDWSHELCSPAEKEVWARASVFAGSFDLDAAAYVCDVPPDEVLELVDGLLDKSVLVRRQDDDVVRYRLLESLREYGQERLERSGERERVARRHAEWFDRLTARAEAGWVSGRQQRLLAGLTRDHANLRAALDRSLSTSDEVGVALRIAARPSEYWLLRGLAAEAKSWLTRALALAAPGHPDRGRALCVCALYTLWLGDVGDAERLVAEAEALDDDPVLHARVLHVRSFVAMLTNRPGSAGLAAETAAAFREHGLVRDELHPLFIHGVSVAYRDRNLETAHGALRRMRELTGEDELFYRAMSLFGEAVVEVEFGDAAAAARAATEALRLDVRLGDLQGRAYRLDTLAWIADRAGEHARAATLFGIAAANWERIGTAPEFAVAIPHGTHIANTRAALGNARFEKAFATGRAMAGDEADRFALDLRAPSPKQPSPLSGREGEVAQLVARGLTSREIAAALVISPRTAETHIQHILAKLGFGNRAQIAAWVARRE